MKEIPVTFRSHGKQLVGVLHLPSKKSPFCIIMCHGFSANKMGTWSRLFVHASRTFSKNGFAVLRFDFRGSGDSEGRHEDQTITSRLQDLDAAVRFLKSANIDTDKLGLIGHSMGGATAVIYAAKNKNVKCIAAWSPLSDFKDLWNPLSLRILDKVGYVIVDNSIHSKKLFLDEQKYDLLRLVKSIKAALLVAVGDSDITVPPLHVELLYKAAKQPKKYIVLKNVDHYFNYESQQKQIISLSFSWFKKYLRW